MTVITVRQRTIIQTRAGNDSYQTLLTLEGVSLPLDPYIPVAIDGIDHALAGKRSVVIESGKGLVTTTITVVEAL